jgi:outer membrane protein TolC
MNSRSLKENKFDISMHLLRRITFIFIFFGFACFSSSVSAQDENKKALTYENFIEIVRLHHPIANQAELQPRMGDAVLLSNRGNFDPIIYRQTDEKYFNNIRYFGIMQSGIKIPTILGIEFYGGLDQSGGAYLNPDKTLPQSGLAFAGVSLPIGEGLIMNKRRADLEKAKLFLKAAHFEKQLMLNELIYDAAEAYWDWFVAFNVKEIYKNALILAINRKEFVKKSALLGDMPYIDTTEATIQVQNLQFNLLQSEIEYYNASALLSTFLWLDGNTPLLLDSSNIPNYFTNEKSNSTDSNILNAMESLLIAHPKMEQVRLRIKELQVEKRYRQNLMLPTLNLKYNAINEPVGNNPFTNYSSNNFTWGIQFAMPILVRKERGDLRQTNLHIQQMELDSGLFMQQLRFHALANLNNWKNTNEQSILYRQTVSEHFTLLLGERRKFEEGESSVFMVNTREINYINAQINLVNVIGKNRKAVASSLYSLGISGI